MNPGQTGHIQLDLDFYSFAFWDVTNHGGKVAPGTYQILVGSSSRDIRFQRQITILVPTEVTSDKKLVIPAAFKLEQNFPNPFNPTTIIRFEIPEASTVTLRIYDRIGREVVTLVNGFQTAGYHNYEFNAADLPSGVYFCRMTALSMSGSHRFSDVKKFVLAK